MLRGLSSVEANRILNKSGYNELPTSKSKNIWLIAFEVLKEPMFLLLISCGILYMVLGDYKEGSILLSTIFIIIFITFYQYQKTEKALQALKNLSAPRALVLRDGKEIRIPGRELVRNDVILVHEGDRIPADAILLESSNLSIDESLLTGESVPVMKSTQADLTTTHNLVFSGTLVVQGKGLAEVIATGCDTQFGKIGNSLLNIPQENTRLQKEMKLLIRNLFIIGVFISVGVAVAFYLTRGNLIQALLNGLASAMAILPEEFPVVLTIFLALGAWRLSKKNVLSRKPSAIETLGSATVLCSDKTGTITQNNMELVAMYCCNELFAKNTFKDKQLESLISSAFYASQTNPIDPMEKAIINSYLEIKNGKIEKDILIKEYPLSKELFATTRVTQLSSDNNYQVCCKGAPEAIFSLCKMSRDETAGQLQAAMNLAQKGYRVLGVAKAFFPNKSLPGSQNEFDFVYQGLIGFEDPIRPEVPHAINECNEAGIKVIMITGDFPATALNIAQQIGMNAKGILTGEDLTNMSDEELRKRIPQLNVFARVIPEQKLRIVSALKANKEIVAMTGDGVNDAPALKAAQIGIAMGVKGTDVAREVSSLVLLDDNFASIVAAIRSGRKIFDNLQKAMSYIIAIHIPIIGLALLPAFFPSFPLLLMPIHIVFMELIIDPVCSVAFETEQEEKGIMKRLPRNPNEKFFGGRKILFSALEGILLLAMVIIIYFMSIKEGHNEGEIRAIAFSALIIGNVFLILSSLSKTRNVLAVLREKNLTILLILFTSIALLLLTISIPWLQTIFSFRFPGFLHFASSLSGAFAILFCLETVKYFRNLNKI